MPQVAHYTVDAPIYMVRWKMEQDVQRGNVVVEDLALVDTSHSHYQ
jgi:hypothetical protein